MQVEEGRAVHINRRLSTATVAAHLSGSVTVVLLLVWLIHFRRGLDISSENADRVFNVHPFLMFFGFVFLIGEGVMAFQTVRAERRFRKWAHLGFHLTAILLGIVGLHSAFKYHEMKSLANMYSFHSWIGILTFSLFILQWLGGLSVFMSPRVAVETKAGVVPWHVFGGRALLYLAGSTVVTGLMEAVVLMEYPRWSETRLVNFIGLFVLLFIVSVDLSVARSRAH